MKMRIYCPECRHQLVLRRATIDSTRVKCQNCGAKFYAGKAEAVASPAAPARADPPPPPVVPPAASRLAEPNPADEEVAPEAAAAVAEVPEEEEAQESGGRRVRRKERVKVAAPSKLPGWVIPLGVAVLVLTSALGLFLSQRAPGVPDLPKPAERPAPVDPAHATVVRNPNALVYPLELRRPDRLVGVWELQEPGGGTIEFAADGLVEINAPLVTAERLKLTARWNITSHEGPIYEIEIGPELARDGNHRTRVVLDDPDTLRLTKYAVPGKLSVRERIFKRRH